LFTIPKGQVVPDQNQPPVIHSQIIVWENKRPKLQIRVQPPGGTEKVFDVHDEASVLEALHYNNTWKYARMWGLYRMWRLAVKYAQAIKIPNFPFMADEYLRRKVEDKEGFSQVRKEVFLLIQTCCYQEGELITDFLLNIQEEILTDPTNELVPTWVWKTWPECL
jgi:hypothetical protein